VSNLTAIIEKFEVHAGNVRFAVVLLTPDDAAGSAEARQNVIFANGSAASRQRDLVRARTSEGRERAKARGVKLGRKPKLTDHQKREAIRQRDVDGEPVREIARSYNVSHSTISRLAA
jgi:DNA invertase Pin-like site-specific DNA recombinase